MDMEEIWKDIEGYEGLYQVSSFGRVKSVERVDEYYIDGVLYRRPRKEKILSQQDNHEYKRVSLGKNGKMKWHLVQKLVAKTFVPNPHNLPQVNHKDENKANNMASNLEWCSRSYNINYGNRNDKCSNKMKNRKDLSKPLYCPELEQTFPSISEAARQTNTHFESIQRCVHGKQLHAGGLTWVFA